MNRPRGPSRPGRSGQTAGTDLFVRWLMLVYLPLVLLAIMLLLFVFRLLRAWGIVILVLFAAYAVVPVRLILERRRRGLSIPAPRSMVLAASILGGVVLVGLLLFVVGMNRLSSWGGLAMAVLGGFLMILSVTVPFFKIVDVAIRGGSMMARGASKPRRRPRP